LVIDNILSERDFSRFLQRQKRADSAPADDDSLG
jgi:hypothetical protein